MGYLNRIMRFQHNLRKRKALTNKTFSLVANNCVGSFICHDLGLQFRSPFVNLWMEPGDFVKLLGDLKGYLSHDLKFIKEERIDYPVALLQDVKIYFTHYATEEEAYQKWHQRLERMNYENLYVLFVETDGCTYDNLTVFERLPFCNKVMLTHKEYPELKSAVQIPGYEDVGYVGKCYHYKNTHTGIREYDAFDYVSWFNAKGNT